MESVNYKSDLKSPTIRIPATELAPGSVMVRNEKGETYYTDSTKFKAMRYWESVPLIAATYAGEAFRQLLPFIDDGKGEDEWVSGFAFDVTPWKEIALWCAAATAYRESIDKFKLKTKSKKHDAFRSVIAALSSQSPDYVPAMIGSTVIGRKRVVAIAKLVAKYYREYWCVEAQSHVWKSFVPDGSVPISMTDKEMIEFAIKKGRTT